MSVTKKTSLALFVIIAFVAGGVFFTTAGAGVFGLNAEPDANPRGETTRLAQSPPDFQSAFASVAESVNPAVVQIQTAQFREEQGGQPRSPFDFFRQGPRQQPGPREGLGSGVFIRSNGYIATNNHVVEGADELTVITHEGEEYEAEIVGTDPYSDLAVIKVDGSGFRSVGFGNADALRTGQWVMAFGSPLSREYANTATAGIISALGRLQEFGGRQSEVSRAQNYIQTDAAVNPGNSGGPLVNLNGELVGINTAIASASGFSRGNVGLAFAIPVNVVKTVTDELIETGSIERAQLGVRFLPVPSSLRQAQDLPRGAVEVSDVVDGSAAAEAGVRSGDIIVSVDGQELTDNLQLAQIVGSKRAGDAIQLTVLRDGERSTLDATLQEMETGDTQQQASAPSDAPDEQMMEQLGFSVSNITPRVIAELRRRGVQLQSREGVIVREVNPRSEAYREARIRQYRLIREMAGESIANLEDFRSVYDGIEAGETFTLRATIPGQQGGSFTTALTKPS